MSRFRLLAACIIPLLSWQATQAQSNPAATIARSASSPAKATDSIAARSLRLSRAAVPARPSSADKQIQVEVRFILLETKTRERMYETLKHENVKTAFASMPKPSELVKLPTSSSDRQSFDTLLIPSQVTTTTMGPETFKSLLFSGTLEKPGTKIVMAPKLIVVNGLEAEFRNVVQKPFIVGANYISGSQGDGREPVVKVCEEGMTVHVRATMIDEERVELASRIVSQQITTTHESLVYGIGPEPTQVQIPIEHLRTVSASETVRFGDTLLVDPYVSIQNQEAETATGVPILQRLPYIGRKSFKRVAADPERHLIFTLTPWLHVAAQIATEPATTR